MNKLQLNEQTKATLFVSAIMSVITVLSIVF
jgi:hypothetical protein